MKHLKTVVLTASYVAISMVNTMGMSNLKKISVFTICSCGMPKSEFCVAATEIRCQEKSKGGLSFEVILAEPLAGTPPKRASPLNNKASVENIEEKLKAAEERRLVRFLRTELVEHRGTAIQTCTLRMLARSIVQFLSDFQLGNLS
jgi:hypothetical protein